MKRIAIIGAGIGGIGTAIRLATRGYEVHVYEKNNWVGGKIAELNKEGFRFDMGPSLFTLPDLVTELFELNGEDSKEYFSYRQLKVITRYFFSSGKKIDALSDPKDFIDELNKQLGEQPDKLWTFFKRSQTIYELTKDVFIFGTFHKWKVLFSKKFLRAFVQWWKLDPLVTMQKSINRYLKTVEGRQLFGRYATYNGSSPYLAPGTLNVIPHLEHSIGAFFPDKGMYSIPQSLYELAKRAGAKFHLETEVEQIILNRGEATGIKVQGKEISFDTIVSDVDVFILYKKLLPQKFFPKALLKHDRSTSALIFYWGMNREFPELDVHNILFAEDYREEFNCLFKTKSVHSDPTVYLFISSKTVDGDAPKGSENWFVMINTPSTDAIDWGNQTPIIRQLLLAKIEKMLEINVEQNIVTEEILTPTDIEERTNSHLGALYGISSNSRMAAFARHANFSSQLKNMYFVGGSVHPGGGIPLCLASAKIVDQLIHGEI